MIIIERNIENEAYTMDGFADFVDCETSCLKPRDFIAYGKGKRLYGWHISDLVIYDKPKELSDFSNGSSVLSFSKTKDGFPWKYSGITRPPQSWGYVEELKNE